MTLPEDILHRSPEEAARRVALGFLAQARDAFRRLADPDDAAALHDFRVAIRRLRSTLRAWKPFLAGAAGKKDRRALSRLLELTGAGRDAEVLLDWLAPQGGDLPAPHRPGFAFVMERLHRRKASGWEQVRDDLRKRFERVDARLARRLDRMRIEMRLSDPALHPSYGQRLAEQAGAHARELSSHLTRLHTTDDQKEAHRARIAVKRLRYLVEPVRSLVDEANVVVKQCKRLQDLLGNMHDAAVLVAELEETAAQATATARPGRDDLQPGLRELGRRARERMQTLFAELERGWLGEGAGAFGQELDALVRELGERAGAHREIERKYLLSSFPEEARAHPMVEIEQGYLPGRDLRERIRRVRHAGGVDHKRTVKAGRGIERIEVDEPTTPEVFEAMWPLTEGQRVLKRRYEVPADEGLIWEIDEFTDRPLYLAEIELPDRGHPVELPDWLRPHVVREVTDEPGYVNLRLAK